MAAIHTLIHIGAGEGEQLPELLATQAQRLILIEPNPKLAAQLRHQTGNYPQVEILELAIIGKPAPDYWATLHEFNWNQASSLHQPAALLKLFPGLKTRNLIRVKALSPCELLDELQLPAEQPHALYLDTPGEEPAIIQALSQTGQLKQFSNLNIRYAANGLYQGTADPEQMHQQILAQGFSIHSQTTHDPDWPQLQCERNPLQNRLDELAQQLDYKTQALNETEQGLQAAKQQLETSQHSITELTKQVTQLTQQQQALSSDHTTLKQSHAALTQERDALQAQLAHQASHMEQLQARIAELAAVEARQTELDAEFALAESQMQLIREVLMDGDKEKSGKKKKPKKEKKL